jgi:outer membrane protein
MHRFQTVISILCVRLLIAPAFAQQAHEIVQPAGPFSWLTGRYRNAQVPPINVANSNRLDSLLRAGRLYLSLQDTIALALENNLDIEIQRYGPQIADAKVLRAKAGGFAQGVSTSVTAGPTSAQPGGVAQSGVTGNPSTQASAASATAVGNTVITQSGPVIPSFDPALVGSASWAHQTVPESSTFISGTDELVQRRIHPALTYQQGFQTGTQVSLGLNNSTAIGNSANALFNPATSSSLGITVTQHLLQGFSIAVNQRQIVIAKNNRSFRPDL